MKLLTVEEKDLWKKVFIACARRGASSYGASEMADSAVLRFRTRCEDV